jgi:bifunctional enzyme CysN/CysC
LLRDTGGVYEDQLAAVKKASGANAGSDGIDLALITDGLKAEREQGITIDVAYRYFTTAARKFIIADTPGHEQYTRNMATGASTADVAIILIDARHGVLAQTRRHSCIANLLGIPNLLVCINKLDLVDFDQAVFDKIVRDFTTVTEQLSFKEVQCVPVSALAGDNVVAASERTPWYEGPTVLSYLENVPIGRARNYDDFCFPVQYVNRPNLDFRGYCGSVASGTVKPGQEVQVLPSGKRSTVKAIHTFDGELDEAFPPQAVTLTLSDEIDISRGDVLTTIGTALTVSRHVEADLVWMNEKGLEPGRQYLFKHLSNSVPGTVSRIHYRLDINDYHQLDADGLALNEIGRVTLNLSRPIVADRYADNREAGAFIVIDRISNLTVAAGMITGFADSEVLDGSQGIQAVTPAERGRRFGQQPCMVWLSGLPGTGKTRLGQALERRLFDAGHLPSLLDRERVPKADAHGRGAGLDPILDAAAQVLELGVITIVAFTSPEEADRTKAKAFLDRAGFLHVHLKASQAFCQQVLSDEGHDPSQAEIPFEAPEQADLVIDAEAMDVEHEVDRITALLREQGLLR